LGGTGGGGILCRNVARCQDEPSNHGNCQKQAARGSSFHKINTYQFNTAYSRRLHGLSRSAEMRECLYLIWLFGNYQPSVTNKEKIVLVLEIIR